MITVYNVDIIITGGQDNNIHSKTVTKNMWVGIFKNQKQKERLIMSATPERSSNFLSTRNSQKPLIINKLTNFLKFHQHFHTYPYSTLIEYPGLFRTSKSDFSMRIRTSDYKPETPIFSVFWSYVFSIIKEPYTDTTVLFSVPLLAGFLGALLFFDFTVGK